MHIIIFESYVLKGKRWLSPPLQGKAKFTSRVYHKICNNIGAGFTEEIINDPRDPYVLHSIDWEGTAIDDFLVLMTQGERIKTWIKTLGKDQIPVPQASLYCGVGTSSKLVLEKEVVVVHAERESSKVSLNDILKRRLENVIGKIIHGSFHDGPFRMEAGIYLLSKKRDDSKDEDISVLPIDERDWIYIHGSTNFRDIYRSWFPEIEGFKGEYEEYSSRSGWEWR